MKKLVFLLIFLGLAAKMFAQDWQTDFSKGVQAYQAANYKEAITQLTKAKQNASDYIGTNNVNYFYIITILARAYEANWQLKEAEKNFIEAYQLAKTLFPQNQEGFLVLAAHNVGKNYYLQQNYLQAEKYTSEAYEFIKNEPQNQDYAAVCHTLGATYKELEKFNEAERMFGEVKKQTNPEKTLYYDALNGLAVIFYKKGKLKEAESAFLQLLTDAQKKFGNSENYANYLHNAGAFYKEIHQTLKAEQYLKEAWQLREKLLGNQHPDYALTCSYLGYVYQDLGKWQEAEKLFQTAKHIYKQQNLQQDYLLVLNNIASLQEAQALYKEAEKNYKEAMQICEKVLGKENTTYSMLLQNLAGLYQKQGFFTTAEPLFQSALNIEEKILGSNSLKYQQTAMNYAIHKLQKGEINFAEKELEKSVRYFEKTLGKGSLPYITALMNLAMIDLQKERYLQAEEKYVEAQKLCEQNVGKNSETYIILLNNVGQFYTSLGNLEKALQCYQAIFELAAQIWSEKHINYAVALRNVAYILTLQGQLQEAEQLCEKSLAIIQKNYDENHPEYIVSLNNLASIYFYQKKYKNLIVHLQKALHLAEKLYGAEYSLNASLMNNLAMAYVYEKNYEKALPLVLQTLNIKEKIWGKEHQEYLTTLQNLAWLYSLQNKLPDAEKTYKQVVNKQIDRIFRIFPILSESEKIAFLKNQQVFFLNYVSFCLDYSRQKPAILGDLLDFRLITKGMIAEISQNLQKKVTELKKPEITKLYNEWLGKKNEFLRLINAPSSEKTTTQISQVSEELNALEKELSKSVDIFGKKRNTYSWKEIQKQLKPDEIAIEVIRTYQTNSANPQKIDTVYVFLVLTAQTTSSPELLFVPQSAYLETDQIALYANAIRLRKKNYNKELYDSFWGNVIKQSKVLQNINFKKIYFSPDGIYHKINLATLYDETRKQFLGDYLQIIQLTNLKKLTEKNTTATTNKTAFLIGYPDYEGTEKSDKSAENRGFSKKITAQEKKRLSRFLDFDNVTYLPGTKKETDRIAQILAASGTKTTLFQSKDATEEVIKKIQNPTILHIATHGFFLEDVAFENTENQIGIKEMIVSKNPLLRSGLLLANCSKSLKNAELNSNQEDGVLTAYEASQLNLQNTELVVLSACETGLGEIMNGEGVFGLQRAFLQAGAKNLIISLWKVDDTATQEFMSLLYENWQVKKLSLQDSFSETQKIIRQKYPEPYYWGAFVMVGE